MAWHPLFIGLKLGLSARTSAMFFCHSIWGLPAPGAAHRAPPHPPHQAEPYGQQPGPRSPKPHLHPNPTLMLAEGATRALEALHPSTKVQTVATGPWRGHFLSEALLGLSQPGKRPGGEETEAAEWQYRHWTCSESKDLPKWREVCRREEKKGRRGAAAHSDALSILGFQVLETTHWCAHR